MISLKATSISRSLKLLLALLLLAGSLGASPYSVAVVCEDEGYKSLIEEVLSALSGPVTAEEARRSNQLRLESAARFSRESAVSGYRTAEDSAKLEAYLSNKETAAYDGISVLTLTEAKLTETEKDFLRIQDPDALEYVLVKYALDLLILADVEDEGQVSEAHVWANGDLIYSSLYRKAAETEEFGALLEALLPFFRDRASVIVRVDAPATVAIAVDGIPVSPVRRTLVLERGAHVFRYSSYSYHTLEERINVEEGTVLSPYLSPVYSGPAFLSAVPYDARLYYQGETVENHVTENGTVPYAVTAVRDGFSLLVQQSTVPSAKIRLELNPAWTDDNNVLEREKRRFYNSLLGTLLSFGCYVGSLSLESIYPDDENFPVTTIAFTGLSLLQLVELVDSMFGYYQAAKLGI